MEHAFSFNFSEVSLNDNDLSLLPLDKPVCAVIDKVEYRNFTPKGQTPDPSKTRLVITQTVIVDDNTKIKYETKISPRQPHIVMQYLTACNESVADLDGQPLSQEGLEGILRGKVVTLTFRSSTWKDDSGTERTTIQVKRVSPYSPAQAETVVPEISPAALEAASLF